MCDTNQEKSNCVYECRGMDVLLTDFSKLQNLLLWPRYRYWLAINKIIPGTS
jgi:hypothetical protein